MDRQIATTTYRLIEAMANDPRSPKRLREFHQKQLADLQRRMEMQRKPKQESPFSRFVDRLCGTDQTL
jgi:hypothetical protein